MSITFRYLDNQPFIEFFLRSKNSEWKRFLAYVDSGAYITVLPREDATRLGINITSGQSTELHGVSGSVPAFIHPIEVKISDQSFHTDIAFSTANETPRLLGRLGIFEKFIVCFNDSKKQVSFQ